MNKKVIASLIIVVIIIISGISYVYIHSNTATSGKITVKAYNGNFSFNHTVTRIVSLDPAATATLYALGAYNYIVGGNIYDCYPPHENITVAGNLESANIEEIINLSAQVVIGTDLIPQSTINKLNSVGITFLEYNPSNISGIECMTSSLGSLTGKTVNATLINQWINESINDINSVMKNYKYLSVFYYLYPGYWTAGNNTFINDAFNMVHLKNIANNNGYYTISRELIESSNPDVIILNDYIPYSVVNETPFSQTNAVRDHMVFTLTGNISNLFNEPDFRFVYAVYWLMITVHPSLRNFSLPSFPLKLKYGPGYGL
ncbi:ABC transporter substrate-binding protein [Picrophilus oshimae]|uniref:Iron complex transport system substrate-binding protein n=1 Tax=Picrophilus torridus (strain ATCC 700027 / DSM 9790 / JCM 10055 / NBRC 100828 / KAW 2/3) TaxID=1122961 RepID=A0A8G2FWY7_PICTO|nr:ABC transporter substrate-binding protein [Picrophilus oshimae]SMD31026.1 iron complex transport system substrate-binding protein [Picrophilus oshimae DSM 9789]